MVSEETIKRVTRALTRPLLPTEGLRQAAHSVLSRKVELAQLLEPEDDVAFLQHAYLTLLGRAADQQGVKNWLAHLRGGKLTRAAVIHHLLDSEEGRRKNIVVPGLPILVSCNDLPSTATSHLTRQGISKKEAASAVKLAAAVDREINDVETQIQRLAAECLSNFEHIEHRLSKVRPDHALAAKETVHVVELKNGGASDSRVALLHRKLDRMPVTHETTRWKATVDALAAAYAAQPQATRKSPTWLVSRSESRSIVQACRAASMAVTVASCPPSQSEYMVSKGAEVDDRDAVALMKASAGRSIDICWLQLDTTTLDDTAMFAFLDETARVCAGGLVIVESVAGSDSVFERSRLLAMTEICGWMDANDAVQQTLRELDSETLLWAKHCPQGSSGERV